MTTKIGIYDYPGEGSFNWTSAEEEIEQHEKSLSYNQTNEWLLYQANHPDLYNKEEDMQLALEFLRDI